jgi:hypothetical protein
MYEVDPLSPNSIVKEISQEILRKADALIQSLCKIRPCVTALSSRIHVMSSIQHGLIFWGNDSKSKTIFKLQNEP